MRSSLSIVLVAAGSLVILACGGNTSDGPPKGSGGTGGTGGTPSSVDVSDLEQLDAVGSQKGRQFESALPASPQVQDVRPPSPLF